MQKRAAHADMIHTLEQVQEDLARSWIDQSLPDEWNGLDTFSDVGRHKTRVTVRLDTDMVKWFRKMGPGYGARMNDVLRCYYTALLAGHIKGYWNDDVTPRLQAEAARIQAALKR
ncbi:MAG: BrnA antitoxin family protein [Pseudomonadota bacterium]